MVSSCDEREKTDELEQELWGMDDAASRTDIARSDKPAVRFTVAEIQAGRPMALLSYCSILFGIPVFIAPLVLRNNAFSLHHAKAAGVIYIIGTALIVAAFLNCSLFLPLAFVCYIPALIGIYRAAAGDEAGSAALGTAGERVFKRIEVKS